MNFIKLFNRTAVKITVLVAGLCTLLLIILNILVLSRSEQDLITVYRTYPIYTFEGVQIQSFPTQVEVPKPFREKFTEKFQFSLLLINILGLAGSVGVGVVTAFIITQPLRQIEKGIKDLQSSNYQISLKPTGDAEFDQIINELNTLAAELARVETLRKDLISDTSHELKTPLASLIGQLEGLRDKVFKPTPDRIEGLITQTNRLKDLVEKLQEYSRLRSKTLKLNKQPINFAEMIGNLQGTFADRLSASKMAVQTDIAAGFELVGDRGLVEQLFTNLFDNAIKHSQAKAIKLTAKPGEITFQDNGVGMDKEGLVNIFERFYRADKSRSRDTGGLGLGMAIVKEIAEAHGWKISAVSFERKGLIISLKLT